MKTYITTLLIAAIAGPIYAIYRTTGTVITPQELWDGAIAMTDTIKFILS